MFGARNTVTAAPYEQRQGSLSDKILYVYRDKNIRAMKGLVRNQPLNLLVEALESIGDIEVIIRFIVAAHRIKMGQLFLSLSEENKVRVLSDIRNAILTQLLNDLNADDVYELLTYVPAQVNKKIILNVSRDLKEEIKKLKSFNFAEAGSIMNTTFLTLESGMRVRDAINYLKINRDEFDIGEEVHVISPNDRVEGTVKIKNLMFADKEGNIMDGIDRSFFQVNVSDDIDDVIELFKRYSAHMVAVTDSEGRLVGEINYQDVIPEIIEDNMEDVHRFYGIQETRRSYLENDVMGIVKSRIFCLIIVLMSATLTTFAIDKFESLGVNLTAGISSAILVPIIPIITDMCGNTGSQTTATVIQAFALGEVRDSDFWRIVKKELRVAAVIGGILAVCNFLRLVGYFALFPLGSDKFHISGSTQSQSIQAVSHNIFTFLDANGVTSKLTHGKLFQISMVGSLSSSISLFLVVIFSKFFGVLIPFLAMKFDYDPASVSSPILTTILDTVSSIIFFGIGIVFLTYAINPIFGVTVTGGKLAAASAT